MRPSLIRPLHTTDRPSATAQLVTVWRALELERPPAERIVSDEYAPAFLDRAGRAMLAAARAGRPVLRTVERQELAGISTHVLCRHAFIDDHLLAAISDGIEQVIVLGAGYDSRAWRFAPELDGRTVYEVDLPPLSRHKASVVRSRPDLFGHAEPVRVEIDFRRQALPERLQACGFEPGRRTFVVWEGVVPYLPERSVTGTLQALAELCAPGSVLALDAYDGRGGPDRYAPLRRFAARALSWIGEPVAFGLPPAQLRAFLAERGWPVTDLADAVTLAERYATDGRRSDPSVYALAAALAD